jgi:hypothetical protein
MMNVRTGIMVGSGLGDTIADLARLTGMDKVAKGYEQLTGKSCGCEQRQAKLNQLFPSSTLQIQ